MEIKTNRNKKRLIKIWLWLVFAVLILTVFVSLIIILNQGNKQVVVYFFGGLLLICSLLFFPYIVFMTKMLELLSTQKIFYSENHLLFYFTRRDGGPEGFGEQHFYDKKKEVIKVKKNKLLISVKGVFQTKTEGFPTLETQNPDDEPSKLTFDEQVGLIYFEDSYLKKKTVRILRIFDNSDEELLLNLLFEKGSNDEVSQDINEVPATDKDLSEETSKDSVENDSESVLE